MGKYCKECGHELKEEKYCPECGAKATEDSKGIESDRLNANQSPKLEVGQSGPPKKKAKTGCLAAALICLGFVLIIPIIGKIHSETSVTKKSPETILKFDERTWKDFKLLYTSHNNFLKSMDTYASSKVTGLDFYNKCAEAKEYFRGASMSFDYGTTDDERDYLSAFQSAALSDQQAAEALIKYIDSKKTADIAYANENIQNAKTALTMIASNRGKLLVKAGLTDDEILEKVKADMAELEGLSE